MKKSYSYDGQVVSKGLEIMVTDILSFVYPRHIIDVGCGIGCWLSVFKKHGVDGVGLDGSWVPKERLLIDDFREIDLTRDSLPDVKADMVVCVEVAEHLPSKRAESFIHELTMLAPLVLFSAAIPSQGGTNHVNERWQSYWVSLFKKHNYIMVDCLRQRWWDNKDVDAFAKQNMFFFVDATKLLRYPRLFAFKNSLPVDVVHPDMYTEVINHGHTITGVMRLLLDMPEIVKQKIKGAVR